MRAVGGPGDSGSVWLDDANAVVGLHFAGQRDQSGALASPISDVFDALDVIWSRGVRTHDLLEIVDNVLD
ncbi:hypothetical protein Poly30_07510 [Planctomycetes bacterium Poly30]|uniref:Serine protease n=1 Tax=Saltatorellus ferox TaxID=2528018 RepID=A0A518EME4_9BACT|nr:hypothetical protein Poly30_07510 [Planctomycetes bacterium Poly30]